jgi:hypothetical protein
MKSNIFFAFQQLSSGCCPNKNSFERSLERFLRINLGEAEDQRFELFEPEGRVFKSPGASLRFIKKRFRPSEKEFGQQPVIIWQLGWKSRKREVGPPWDMHQMR